MAVIAAPVIGDGGARYIKQPLLHTLAAASLVDAARCLEKYFRCQVLGIFPIANLAIDITVDQTHPVFIQCLKFLPICGAFDQGIGRQYSLHSESASFFSSYKFSLSGIPQA